MKTTPIIIVSYDDRVRQALTDSVTRLGVSAVCCATFCEAENLMLNDLFRGIVVDLTSMIKAKGEEKIVACSLTGFFPTLRVRAVGPLVVPMAMSGDAKQDNSLNDFLNITSLKFLPRRLRSHKRKELFVPLVISRGEGERDELRSCTLNISWGGMFIIDMYPERFTENQQISVYFPDFEFSIMVTVVWINDWRQRKAPGIGIKFPAMTETLEAALSVLLKTNKDCDRDRLVA